MDAEFYWNLAGTVAAGGGLPRGALTYNPLYPFFLIGLFEVLGRSLLAARLVQFLIGLATLSLIYLAGKRLGGSGEGARTSAKTVSLTAMAIAALYPQFMLYEGMLLGSALEVFLLTAALVLSIDIDRDILGESRLRVLSRRIPTFAAAAALGLVCGAGALGRPNLFLLLAAGIPVWMIVRHRRVRTWLVPAAGFILGVAVFLLPPIIHNARHTGRFVPVTAHGGINFYIGNRPGTEGVYSPPEEIRGGMRGLVEDARLLAEKETGREMTDAEASGYYMDRTLSEIARDPVGWLVLLMRKFVLFWNRIEVHDMAEVLYFEDALPIFSLPFIPFSVIAPLGAAGLVVLLAGGRNRSVVCLFLGAGLVSILLFYVNTRYRLPVVPVIILLAAYFISWAARGISAGRTWPVARAAAFALAVFLLVSNRTLVRANPSSVYTLLGTYYMKSGEEEKAAEALAEAYRLDPGRDTSMINYARLLMRQEKYLEASRILARAYELNPNYPHVAIEYAYSLHQSGRTDRAAEIAGKVYSSSAPAEDRVNACKLLATIAFFEGNREEVADWARAGLRIAPDDPELRQMLEAVERME